MADTRARMIRVTSLASWAAVIALGSTSLAQPVPVIAVSVQGRGAPAGLVERVAVAVGHDARRGDALLADLDAHAGALAPREDTLRAARDEANAAIDRYFVVHARARRRIEDAVRALEASQPALEAVPENRDAYLRALMTLARIDFEAHVPTASAWIERVVAFDATWTPPAERTPPAIEAEFQRVRSAHTARGSLTVVTPREGCDVSVNGHRLDGSARARSVEQGVGLFRIEATCDGRSTTRTARVTAEGALRVVVDPDLDATLSRSDVALTYATEADAARLTDHAASLGRALDAHRVIVVGAEQVRVIDVESGAVRATIANAANDLAAQVDAALSETRTATPTAHADAPPIDVARTPTSGPGVAPWVLVGAGGAAIAAGAVLLVLRNGAYDDAVSRCATDPTSQAPTCGNLTDAERAAAAGRYDDARTLDTAGWVSLGVGAAAVVGGVVWYAVAPRRSDARARVPTLTGAVASTGASLRLAWTF